MAEQSKTELSRKLKLLKAELKHAKIDYVIDQIPDDARVDGIDAYLEKNLDKVNVDKQKSPMLIAPIPTNQNPQDPLIPTN